MALFNQALALISISALLLSIFAVEAHLAPAPTPTPLSYISSSPRSSPASAPSPSPSESSELVPYDVKAQMSKYVEGNMQVTMQKIEEFAQALKKRLDDPETSSFTKECIQQCDEVYTAAKDDIENSLKDLESGNLYKANFDISSVSTNVDTCEQCFEEIIGEDPELKKFDDWVRGVTDDCLGALDKVAS